MKPKITLMPSGINAHVPSPGNRKPSKRGTCSGWSSGTATRNRRFLMSVEPDQLDGHGVTYTLTVRDVPPSPNEWARLRNALFKAMRRGGLLRLHWVTEWTAKGRPHLHICAFFPQLGKHGPPVDVIATWLRLTAHLGTLSRGQFSRRLHNAAGWFAYVAKHASRGVRHYQRQTAQESLPEGWESSGRMWGTLGEWPTSEQCYEISISTFWRLRRLARSYLVAQARAEFADPFARDRRAALRRWKFAQRMLRDTDKGRGAVRGLGHWIPYDVQEQLVAAALKARP